MVNPNPREARVLTDSERQSILADVEKLYAALVALPTTSETIDRIDRELRDNGTLPSGMARHPAGEEFESYESILDEAYLEIEDFQAELEESLVELRSRLAPWSPDKKGT
jgi:hypothetical protein